MYFLCIVLHPCWYFIDVERAKVSLYPLCDNFWYLMFFRWSCMDMYLKLDLDLLDLVVTC